MLEEVQVSPSAIPRVVDGTPTLAAFGTGNAPAGLESQVEIEAFRVGIKGNFGDGPRIG